jgi:hypothetical protein
MKTMLCILALLPLEVESMSVLPPAWTMLANARMAEPLAVARALTEVVRIDPASAEGGWLADLRGFDGPEQQELSNLLRKEGVGLGDRSKLRRLATTPATQSTAVGDDIFGKRIPRRAQQAQGQEEPVANTLDQGACTGQASRGQPDGGSGLSGDSEFSFLRHPLSHQP